MGKAYPCSIRTTNKRLKLEKHVFLLGQRKNPYYIMKQADVFCLTSHYEGQSMVLLEALTLKVHIIASDIIANRYVLGNGKYGTLVSHDIDDITVALEQCIQNDHLNMKYLTHKNIIN